MPDKLTEDKFLDAINTIYAGFNLMHLKTTEISYDERLDSNVSVICKPFMQDICVCCSSAMSLVSLMNKSRKDAELEDVMTVICCNCIIYLITCQRNIEWYVDNLTVCMVDESVGDLIDVYVKNMNSIYKQIDDILEPYVTDDTREMIKVLNDAFDHQDDDNDSVAPFQKKLFTSCEK